jgi:hypothetical protein
VSLLLPLYRGLVFPIITLYFAEEVRVRRENVGVLSDVESKAKVESHCHKIKFKQSVFVPCTPE